MGGTARSSNTISIRRPKNPPTR
ncbi:MAG: hypothetical protein JWS11_2298, partial [Cypionkella sp.]|nr:hypothetical protein [Cypionkella sp.]